MRRRGRSAIPTAERARPGLPPPGLAEGAPASGRSLTSLEAARRSKSRRPHTGALARAASADGRRAPRGVSNLALVKACALWGFSPGLPLANALGNAVPMGVKNISNPALHALYQHLANSARGSRQRTLPVRARTAAARAIVHDNDDAGGGRARDPRPARARAVPDATGGNDHADRGDHLSKPGDRARPRRAVCG